MKRLASVQIQSRPFHYHSDGAGRDQYIERNNGGLLSQEMLQKMELKPQPKYQSMVFSIKKEGRSRDLLPSPQLRVTHYHGNGTGRDYYIIKTDGGQTHTPHWRKSGDWIFLDSLRHSGIMNDVGIQQFMKPNAQTQMIQEKKAEELRKRIQVLANPKPQPRKPRKLNREYKSWQIPKYQTKARYS